MRIVPRLKGALRSRVLPWVLCVPLLATTVAFGVLLLARGAEDRRADEVLARATEFSLALTNFGSETIVQDVEEISAFATGEFATEVEELFSQEVIEGIQAIDAVSTATVEAVFVQSLGDGQATVFAVLRQSITNENIQGERTDIVRMEIAMVQSEDVWLVERVDLFQAPGGAQVGTFPDDGPGETPGPE